jgi:hypothetical protein
LAVSICTTKKGQIFFKWFNNQIEINNSVEVFLNDLIAENESLVERYNEEDLKIYLISPLLNKINLGVTLV